MCGFLCLPRVFRGSIGVFLTKQEQGLLFRKFDRTGDGSITYDEFITAVRGELTPARLDIVEKAFARLVRVASPPPPPPWFWFGMWAPVSVQLCRCRQ